MIQMRHVNFAYDGKAVLTDFSLDLPQNGIVCLFGASGCGKTTVSRLLLGLEQPQSGDIIGDRSGGVAVFQEDRLLPWKTALQNVSLTMPSDSPLSRAEAALQKVGIDHTAWHKLPAELSGGMCRRVTIARALAADSRWLLLDEPFSGIDADTRLAIIQQIQEYAKDHLVLIITHLTEEIDLLGAQVVHMP